MAVTMKNAVFWDVVLYSSCVNRHFGGTYSLHLQGRSLQPPAHAGSSLVNVSTLKMEAIRSSETSVHTGTTRCHIPENGILYNNINGLQQFSLFLHQFHFPLLSDLNI
jgi:hypothetical protein